MTLIYLIDQSGALDGPVELPVTPGLGIQMPANAISLEEQLPDPSPGYVWSFADDAVVQLIDLRGVVYSTVDGSPTHHDQLGELPDNLTDIPRPGPDYQWKSGSWTQDLTVMYSLKIQEINDQCESLIVGGFVSTALGDPYSYDSQLEDQLNLTGVILSGADSPYPCRVNQANKEFRQHTHAQLVQVGNDFTLTKMSLLQKANVLKQRLDAALADDDADALAAVVWEAGQ